MTEDLLKVKKILKVRGCSDRTVANYISCLNRFKQYFVNKNIEKLDEEDILNYLKVNFIDLELSAATINVNRAAIKYYYLVNFKKEFSNVLLPQCKIKSRFPILISKEDFIKIVNSENNLKHKIWLILGYGSGLRISEIASLKVCDILSKDHKIKILGKGNKERYAPLPEITLKYLRIYWIQNKFQIKDYLFPGQTGKPHINCNAIKDVFHKIRIYHRLDNSMTFHTLRHSFATEFILSGGDIWELKSILGHCSVNTTTLYLHMAKDFSNVKSPMDDVSL